MINKKGETRPMVDLTGKFFLIDELDEDFVKACVNVDLYKDYQGKWVKNAYDPQFTVDGKYDEQVAQAAESLDIEICMMMKAARQAFKIESMYTTIRTAGVRTNPYCTIRWIAGSSAAPLARNV